MDLLKQAKYNQIIEHVKPMMLKQGINTLKISDIAKNLKIGEATIYRYFGTKTNLVIEVGVSLWNDVYKELESLPTQETGYDSIQSFFSFFLEGYKTRREVFVFLDEFDALMVKEKVSKEKLAEYDKKLSNIKSIYDVHFDKGQSDKSLKISIDKDEYYYTTTHMILGICKRLATTGNIVASDEIVNDTTQVKLALEMCMQYIKLERENK